MSKQIKGVVCRKFETNANDMTIVLILNNGSRFPCLAKGIKNPKSKKSAALELGNLVSLNIIEGYNVAIVTDVLLHEEFLLWKKDLSTLFSLQLILEIFQYVCYEDNEHPELYNILVKILQVDVVNKENIAIILCYTLIHILQELGNIPDISYSVDTNEHLADKKIFTVQDSIGYVTDASLLKDQPIDSRLVKIQKFLLEHVLEDSFKLTISKEESLALLRLHIRWLEHIIERELKGKKMVLSSLSN